MRLTASSTEKTSRKNSPARPAGFYGHTFTRAEIRDLELLSGDDQGVSSEVKMMRVLSRRVYEKTLDEAEDLKTWFQGLSTLGVASARIANLSLINQKLMDSRSETGDALSQALNELIEERKGKK